MIKKIQPINYMYLVTGEDGDRRGHSQKIFSCKGINRPR